MCYVVIIQFGEKTSGDFEKMCTLFEILIAVYPIFSG